MVTATPTIHMNGTSRTSLQNEYVDVMKAVSAAKEALGKVTVHMRDYYVNKKGQQEFEKARNEHWARMKMLDEISKDMETLFLAVEKPNTY